MNTFPDILTSSESNESKIAKLQTIQGIGKENASSFVANIGAFMQFLKDVQLESKLQQKRSSPSKNIANTSHPLYNQKVVMTNFAMRKLLHSKENSGELVIM